MSHGSCMYVAFLDASKAFDRVNHTKLFSKLLKLGVPKWIIKVLVQWYCNQSMCVRWGSAFSDFFLVNNGVRQRGILSPLLFNVIFLYISSSSSDTSAGQRFPPHNRTLGVGEFRVCGGVHDSYTFQCGLVGSFTSPGIDTR